MAINTAITNMAPTAGTNRLLQRVFVRQAIPVQ